MKEIVFANIINYMADYLLPEQMKQLEFALETKFKDYKILKSVSQAEEDSVSNQQFLQQFLAAKKVENCSFRTIAYYKYVLNAALEKITKDVRYVTADDIRSLLTDFKNTHNCGSISMENLRRVLSSFYNWLEEESFIIRSPLRKIHHIKMVKEVKDGFSEDEIEELKFASSKFLRDKCIINLLLCSGMRVGELVLLNKTSVNFTERSCVVFGKGAKERKIYFDFETKKFLQEYLASRTDSESALFVSMRDYKRNQGPKRMGISSVETRLRKIGEIAGVKNVHPHRFRRTLATKAIEKGMPIEQVQILLGHTSIDTTLRYAKVKDKNVMESYRKIMC